MATQKGWMPVLAILLILLTNVFAACALTPQPDPAAVAATIAAAKATEAAAEATKAAARRVEAILTVQVAPVDTALLDAEIGITSQPESATSTAAFSASVPANPTTSASGEARGKLSAPDVKVTLCNAIQVTLPGDPAKCTGDFETSVMTDATGDFVFSTVPPGTYYVWFDLPDELKGAELPLCRTGERHRRDLLVGGGAREFCLDGKTLGPTVIVTPGKATTISDTGTVRGVLVDQESDQPVSGQLVVLASYELIDEHDVKYKIEWNAQGEVVNSVETDASGAFSIEAPVGTYVLVSPGGGIHDRMARVSMTGEVLFIEVLADQIVDLGEVQLTP